MELVNQKFEMILSSNITRLFVSIDEFKKNHMTTRVPVSKRLLKKDRIKELEIILIILQLEIR